MKTPQEILKQYWQYDSFRYPQEQIIESVLQKKDTIALLPTGAGKSMCYQLPALMMEGLCVVVSPLIALMKDQVQSLKSKGIVALSLHAGQSYKEMENVLDRCVFDSQVKFLYLSPERIKSELFLIRWKSIPCSILAIDEAHCISQWGYDFRPSYLQIALLKDNVQKFPILALTASATRDVVHDIATNLDLQNPAIFRKGFERPKLSYSCIEEDHKERQLLILLHKIQGSAIVYVNSRNRTKQVADFLQKNKISATYYHAGLGNEDRAQAQDSWLQNKTRVMVATNAFGMGIDKPNVRLVVHMDIPKSIEAYYQEAGRAGRDGEKAYAVLLYQAQEPDNQLTFIDHNSVNKTEIQKCYLSIVNYLKIAIGSGFMASFDFDVESFCATYSMPKRKAFETLRILEQANLIQLTTNFFMPSKLMLLLKFEDLYEFQVLNPKFDLFIKNILRIYGGEIFVNYIFISEKTIAFQTGLKIETVVQYLEYLKLNSIVDYQAQKDSPQLTLLQPRQDPKYLEIDYKKLELLKNKEIQKAQQMSHFVKNQDQCRSIMISQYFEGENKSFVPCGICDNCVRKRKINEKSTEQYIQEIFTIIAASKPNTEKILEKFSVVESKQVLEILRLLQEKQLLRFSENTWSVIKSS